MGVFLEKNMPVIDRVNGIIKVLNDEVKTSKMIKIIIVNLMPKKMETEIQFLNIISNIPFNIKVDFLYMESYQPQNCNISYLKKYYKTFKDIEKVKYDGMIITGAPIEKLSFEEIGYWDEIKKVMDYSTNNVKSTIYICWAALAGLHYHYNIAKFNLDKKVFGVFSHSVLHKENKLLQGFDDAFFAPHSRSFEILEHEIKENSQLDILAKSTEVGVYMIANKGNSKIFVTGHGEYDRHTLDDEYKRDIRNGFKIDKPKNYYVNDRPVISWRSHYNLMFINWIYYYISNESER